MSRWIKKDTLHLSEDAMDTIKAERGAGSIEGEGGKWKYSHGGPLRRYLSKELNDVEEGSILVPEG